MSQELTEPIRHNGEIIFNFIAKENNTTFSVVCPLYLACSLSYFREN